MVDTWGRETYPECRILGIREIDHLDIVIGEIINDDAQRIKYEHETRNGEF